MKKLILGMVILVLAGCSYVKSPIKSRDDQYLKSTRAPALQTPAGVSGTKLGSDYPITGSVYNTGKQAVSIVPPGSMAASGAK